MMKITIRILFLALCIVSRCQGNEQPQKHKRQLFDTADLTNNLKDTHLIYRGKNYREINNLSQIQYKPKSKVEKSKDKIPQPPKLTDSSRKLLKRLNSNKKRDNLKISGKRGYVYTPPPTNSPFTYLPPETPGPTYLPPTNPPPTYLPRTNPPSTYLPPTNPPSTYLPPTNLPPTYLPRTNPPLTYLPPTNPPSTYLPPTNPPVTYLPPITKTGYDYSQPSTPGRTYLIPETVTNRTEKITLPPLYKFPNITIKIDYFPRKNFTIRYPVIDFGTPPPLPPIVTPPPKPKGYVYKVPSLQFLNEEFNNYY